MNFKLIPEIPDYTVKWYRHMISLPLIGKKGITRSKNDISEILIYRDEDGLLRGVLQVFTVDTVDRVDRGQEKKGNFNIMVDPDCCQKGIGIKLLQFAEKKIEINFEQQQYTPSGIKLLNKYMRLDPNRFNLR